MKALDILKAEFEKMKDVASALEAYKGDLSKHIAMGEHWLEQEENGIKRKFDHLFSFGGTAMLVIGRPVGEIIEPSAEEVAGEPTPPVGNAHVADGCEKFSLEQIEQAKACAEDAQPVPEQSPIAASRLDTWTHSGEQVANAA